MLLVAAATAEETSTGLAALGLDGKGLVFQIINFGLLLVILSRFAYRPLLKVLEERRQTIADSLKSAHDIKQEKAELERTKRSIITDARQQAEDIISRGEKDAADIRQHAQVMGQETADRLFKQAEARISRQAEQVKGNLKQEVLHLVALATERVVPTKLEAAQDQILIKEAVAAAERAIKDQRR